MTDLVHRVSYNLYRLKKNLLRVFFPSLSFCVEMFVEIRDGLAVMMIKERWFLSLSFCFA